MTDTDARRRDPPYLWRRKGSSKWYARVRVPPGAGLGKDHIVRSLKTSDRAEALRRLPQVVAEIKRDIERARRDPEGNLRSPGRTPTVNDAEWWRKYLADGGPAAEAAWDAEIERRLGRPVGEEADERGERQPVYGSGRERDALQFAGMVDGRIVPMNTHLESFLKKGFSVRYVSRIRRAVGLLGEWALAGDGGDNIRHIGRLQAAEFIEHAVALGRDPKTVRSWVSALSAYWKWMRGRTLVVDNPWRDQDMPKRRRRPDQDKRSFTDEEMSKLLSGRTSRTLHDLMRLGALTGMRLNEIGRLTVRDCEGGVFVVRESKTEAGVRRVPIHPDLAALVARRSAGKPPEAFLLEELKETASRPGQRAGKAGERFTQYRRDQGVDDVPDGSRVSRVDFHSFRRWFITKAERADQPPQRISLLVGHQEGLQGITLRTYWDGALDDQLKAVVEAVHLPPDAPVESPNGPLLGRSGQGQAKENRFAA